MLNSLNIREKRILNGEKMVSSINVAGNTGYSHIKEGNNLKGTQDFNKTKNRKTPVRKHWGKTP